MKFPIKWHKECLENMRVNALAYKKDAARAVERAERIEKDCIAYDAQIIEAEQRGVPAPFGSTNTQEKQ
jgi:hypothetical protein